MKKVIFPGILISLLSVFTFAQNNTLFDDTRLSSIYVTIPADSLEVIYDSVLSDHYYMARFIFDDTQHRDTLENIGFRLRGNTSRYSQKKSFKISFNEYVPGRKYQGVKKINLNGEHNDPTLIREKLFYDLWKKAGMVERRTCFVKVFINQTYYGLYTNLEEMEKEWLSLVYPDNGGNLYKCTYPADLVYLGNDQQVYKDLENSSVTGGRVYDLQTNKSEDDYTRLVELIAVLDQPVDSQFVTEISGILNTDHYLKSLAMDVATGNWDDYGYNKNNYYLYDNPYNGRFDIIAYDPDNTFGIDWFNIDWGIRDCRNWINHNIELPLAQKMMAVPGFFSRYKLFLDTIANTVIHPDSVFPRIDAMKQLIQHAAEADTYRTLDYGYTIADFNDSYTEALGAHVKYGLKPFFSVRRTSILQQLHPAGTDDPGIKPEGLTISPNPAGDFIRITLPQIQNHCYLTIFDNVGKQKKSFMMDPLTEQTLFIGDLEKGFYYLLLFDGNTNRAGKLLKM